MRIVRFSLNQEKQTRNGVLDDHDVIQICHDPFDQIEPSSDRFPQTEIRLHPPCHPSKIIGIGFNYRHHAEELGVEVPPEPGFFLMPPSSVIGPEDEIVYPSQSQRVEYEGELGVVIGKTARNISKDEALAHVFGYTCVNDVTARDIQFRNTLDFVKAKTFDTFASIGPWIETELNPGDVTVQTYVNGQLRQSGRTSDLIFDIPKLISFISAHMTLTPGDVIATGTPYGVGQLQVGDRVVVAVEGIGELQNTVVGCEQIVS